MDKETLKQKAYSEFKEFLWIALYLWVIFGLFQIYKAVILAEHNIPMAFQGLAAINALALGKVMLIARAFHLGDRYKDSPLIYPTVVKSALYTVVLLGFKVLEEGVVALFRGESFAQGLSEFAGGSWKGMLAFSLIFFVMIIPFVGVGELESVLGKGVLRQIFFNSRTFRGAQLGSQASNSAA